MGNHNDGFETVGDAGQQIENFARTGEIERRLQFNRPVAADGLLSQLPGVLGAPRRRDQREIGLHPMLFDPSGDAQG